MSAADVDELVRRSVGGDASAWRALQELVQPSLAAIARSHPLLRAKGLARLPDDVAEVATATLERLSRSDFQNLQGYLERRNRADEAQAVSFDAWLYGAADFVIREHVRRRFGRAPDASGAAARAEPSKRELHSQAGRLDDAGVERALLRTLGMTAKLTAAEIFAHVEREFAADEAQALRLYYCDDQSFAQIAHALGLAGDKDAERLIRRLNARLRHRFAEPERAG